MDDFLSCSMVRSIPMRSMTSCVSRRPAVSIKRNNTPLSVITPSTVSRVVPHISLTMALSSCNRALSRVLLPVFVSPTMATGTPFFTALPTLNEPARPDITLSTSLHSCRSSARSAKVTSSSLKSSSSSRSDVSLSNLLRNAPNSLLKPPLSWFIASLCDACEVDAMRSATASARLRSILPLRNARMVNSPGAAWRAPSSSRLINICWVM